MEQALSGYGKHPYLPMPVVEEQFAKCLADPSMRSVSAVIRISREQISARGSLGSYRWIAGTFGGLALLTGIIFPFLPPPWHDYARAAALACFGITVVLLVGVIKTWQDTDRLVVEEKEIRSATLAALETLLMEPGYLVRPPDWTEANYLRKLSGQKAGPLVREWLDSAEER